jgi:hypothetical protein
MRWMLIAVLGWALAPAQAQTLDYDFFKSQVEPIFLTHRPGHTRCYVCHGDRSNSAFRLEKLSSGATFWSEEQSRKNFAMASRLVVSGKPEESLLLLHPLAPEAGGGAYHSGGRQFETRDDPAWRTLARWVRGG